MPVLSELIAEVDPSVSTEARLFTIAPCLARVVDPVERMTCSTVGIAIGTAARASAIAVVKMCWVDWPREIPRANMIAMVSAGGARDPQRQRVQLRGQRGLQGGRRLQHPGDVAHLGVDARVPVTIITPLPCVTGEFMNAMFDWSPSPGFSSVIESALFDAGTLSPVSPDSSICSEPPR